MNFSSISTSRKKYSDNRQLFYSKNNLVFNGSFSTIPLSADEVWGTDISSFSNINYIHDTTGLLIFVLTEIDNICLYGTQSKGMKFTLSESNDEDAQKRWVVSFQIEEEL